MKRQKCFQALQVRKSVCCRHDIQHDYVTEITSERLKRFFIFILVSPFFLHSLNDDDYYYCY